MDKKWLIIGLLAVGALFLIPKKKTRARNRIKALSEISLDVKKRCVPDMTTNKIRCRVQQPKEFKSFFTRTSTTPGVRYVMGMKNGKGITQSVMFDNCIWNLPQAKHWFNLNIKRLLDRDKKTLNLSDLGIASHNIFRWKIGNKQIEVIKNPTASEIRQISNEFREKYPRSKESGIRTTYDQHDNKYVWDSDSLYSDVEPMINMIYDVTTHQSQGMAKWLMEDNLKIRKKYFNFGKGKMHDEDYFNPRQQEMFPKLKRELKFEPEDTASIFTVDPLDVCLERKGWQLNKIKKLQDSISAKMTVDMFGKVEKLTGSEVMLQEQIDECLKRLRKNEPEGKASLFGY